MKTPSPPALAAWLLEHASFAGKNEALIGDLQEEFERCRSRSWYWRQALAAISASFASELRDEWLGSGPAVVWAFAFPGLWNLLLSSCSAQLSGAVFHIGTLLRENQPVATIYFFFIFISRWLYMPVVLAFGIATYLLALRSFTLRRFVGGLAAGIALSILNDRAWSLILSVNGLVYWHFVSWLWTYFSWAPQFLTVLIAMWTAKLPWRHAPVKHALA